MIVFTQKYLTALFCFLALITSSIAHADPEKFTQAMSDIQKYYVRPLTEKKLFDDAIRGMLAGLDPHSAYLNQEDFQALASRVQGKFAGLGLDVTMKHGVIQIVSILPDTPAEKVGIQSGDYILMIDNEYVKGMTLRAAVNKMRGAVDSHVTLTLGRGSPPLKPFKIRLKREIIHIPNMKSVLYDEGYAYIKISQFQATTYSEMIQVVKKILQKQPIRGLILDLRNNPGGLFESGVAISDAFLDGRKTHSMVIVSTKGRAKGSNSVVYAHPGDIIHRLPMVLLVNAGTASAAEIVAGALKDNHRAIILGTRTFGKGSVQAVIPIGDNSAIKLTTALYYTPLNISIQAKGITPNIIVREMHLKTKKQYVDNDITEANLQNHLILSNGLLAIQNENSRNTANANGLIYHDYQLYQALNILKGVVLSVQDK